MNFVKSRLRTVESHLFKQVPCTWWLVCCRNNLRHRDFKRRKWKRVACSHVAHYQTQIQLDFWPNKWSEQVWVLKIMISEIWIRPICFRWSWNLRKSKCEDSKQAFVKYWRIDRSKKVRKFIRKSSKIHSKIKTSLKVERRRNRNKKSCEKKLKIRIFSNKKIHLNVTKKVKTKNSIFYMNVTRKECVLATLKKRRKRYKMVRETSELEVFVYDRGRVN